MSILAKSVGERWPDVPRFFYSNSSQATSFFDCPGIQVPDQLSDPLSRRIGRIFVGFGSALAESRPTTVVCDTHWPRPFIGRLREQGLHTVLVLRALSKHAMLDALAEARRDFSAIIIPHSCEELAYLYGTSLIWEELTRSDVTIIGPIARVAKPPCLEPKVIFTLGGGGEYCEVEPRNSRAVFLEAFSQAVVRLRKAKCNVLLAAGPLLPETEIKAWPCPVIRTRNLHEHFGPETLVVGRPGYNTCWEAIAAGSRLILCGDHITLEDTRSRAQYFVWRQYGESVATNGSAIANAVLCGRRRADRLGPFQQQVNSGLPFAADTVINQVFLRDRLDVVASPQGRLERYRKILPRPTKLIARFNFADPSGRVDLAQLARLARRLDYRIQVHVPVSSYGNHDSLVACSVDALSTVTDYEMWLTFNKDTTVASCGMTEIARRVLQQTGKVLAGISVESISMFVNIAQSVRFDVDRINVGLTFPAVLSGTQTTARISALPGYRLVNEVRIWDTLIELLSSDVPTGLEIDAGRDSVSAATFHLSTIAAHLTDCSVGEVND
jgi:hypothetical protein